MSGLFELNWKDLFNWVLFAVVWSVLSWVLIILQTGTFTIAEFKWVVVAWTIAWITYILKRYFSGETGTILK